MSDHQSLMDLAMEVALGLADEAEAAELEARALQDPEAAAALSHARMRLAELDDTATPETLPADMWDRVTLRLDERGSAVGVPPGTVPEFDAETDTILPANEPHAPRSWFMAACTGLAASVMLALALGWVVMTRPDPTVIAVLINDTTGEAVALVEGTEANLTRVTLLGQTAVPEGQVMQVWTKPEDDGPPVSLGLLAENRGTALAVDGLPPPGPEQLYEITFEQSGGSPTGLPTGPIHGKGFAKEPL
ncbi:anti-sigma factor [Tritonibacter scottomollicae]|uniref:anti-sigma factor n=1 Tax=Tritonibacter scottomollicae TaxID=483013 RepID=UPI003BA8480C